MHTQSPKFPARKAELSSIFSVSQIKLSWKNKVRHSLRKSLISDPYEWLDYHVRIDQISKEIEKKVLNGTYRTSQPTRVLVEKSKGLCRQIIIPSPEDALVMQILSDALYFDIQKKAPTNKAFFQPEDHSFSFKKKSNAGDSEYGTFAAWMNFQKSIFGFSETYKFIIITDVANFYDFINHNHLRNIISGEIDVRESVLDVLVFILSGLLWEPDYMPRIDIGLPQMNVDAPRVLAHCFLYELDKYLDQNPNCDFTRFMDDVDIGVNDIQDAKRILRDMDLILQTRQVRLNSGKTRIITSEEAKIHFRIRENRVLDSLLKRIERKKKNNSTFTLEKKLVTNFFNRSLRKKSFDTGNGEKILKRLLSIASSINLTFNEASIIKIIRLRPSVRDNALRHMHIVPLTLSYIRELTKLVESGVFVDHAAYHQIAQNLVKTKAKKDKRIDAQVQTLVDCIITHGPHGFIAGMTMASKFLSPKIIYNLVRDNFEIWQINRHAGRFVGSLTPFVLQTEYHAKLVNTIKSSKNPSAQLSLDFSMKLQTKSSSETAVRNFLKAPNTSFPLKISHAKFGMLLSVLVNPEVPQTQKKNYQDVHATCLEDAYYRKIFSRL